MDYLYLDSIAFPVHSGQLDPGRDTAREFRWGIEIFCDESPQLDYRGWPDDREEQPSDWLAGAEPFLYAQMLPLRVSSPEQLVGRTYSFPQTPTDDPPDWPEGLGWPFFILYLFGHEWVHPMRVSFTEKRDSQYRVEIIGEYPRLFRGYSQRHELRVATWLELIPVATEV